MEDGLAWIVIGLLTGGPIFFAIAMISRRTVGSWWALLLWAVAMLVSTAVWGTIGMQYEDFDRPFPWWWAMGLGAAEVGFAVALVGTAWKLLRLWLAFATGAKP